MTKVFIIIIMEGLNISDMKFDLKEQAGDSGLTSPLTTDALRSPSFFDALKQQKFTLSQLKSMKDQDRFGKKRPRS